MRNAILSALLIVLISAPSLFGQSDDSKVIQRALKGTFVIGVEDINIKNGQVIAGLGVAGADDDILKAYTAAFKFTGFPVSGSGFAIEHKGKLYVVTNAHVIDLADRETPLTCVTVENTEYKAEIVGLDNYFDVGVLRLLKKPGKEILPLKFATTVNVGQPIYALGSPGAHGRLYQFTVTNGIVSAVNRRLSGNTGWQDYLQHTALLTSGNSGGPLIDRKGHVVGLNTSIISDVPQFNFALMPSRLSFVVNELINYGHVRRAYIGVQFTKSVKIVKRLYRSPKVKSEHEHPVIESVIPGSPASKVLSDVIGKEVTVINGSKVESIADVASAMEDVRPGDKVKLEVQLSSGKTQEYVIQSVEMDDSRLAAICDQMLERYSTIDGARSYRDALAISDVAGRNSVNDEYRVNDKIWSAGDFDEERHPDGRLWKVEDKADLGRVFRLCAGTGMFHIAVERGLMNKDFLFVLSTRKNVIDKSHIN